jgi:hypothetical protein
MTTDAAYLHSLMDAISPSTFDATKQLTELGVMIHEACEAKLITTQEWRVLIEKRSAKMEQHKWQLNRSAGQLPS